MAAGDKIGIIQQRVKNYIINGSMSFSQRAASFNSSNGYALDRHYCFRQGGLPNLNVSWDASNPRPLPMLDHWLHMSRAAGDTSTSSIEIVHALETKDALELQGKNCTFSFYARKGVDFSSVDGTFEVVASFGRGVDEGVIASFTGQTTLSMTLNDATKDRVLDVTSKRFNFNFDVPSDATQIRLEIIYAPTGTAGSNDFFAVTGMMLNEGPLANFVRAGDTYSEEFSLCQRYFETGRWQPGSIASYGSVGTPFDMGMLAAIQYRQNKRIIPIVTNTNITTVGGNFTRGPVEITLSGFVTGRIYAGGGAGPCSITFDWQADAEL